MADSDTIFALATAAGAAGIAVLRLSGPGAGPALHELAGLVPRPRRAMRAKFRDPATGEAIDDGLALFFPGPRSFTGEDVAELQLHGSRAVVAALLAILGRFPGFRLAEPGEFTRRAFENGKLDLTAVEGLADLVAAETEAQRRQALRQLEGDLGRLYEGWRERGVRALARLEAEIDFPDEALPAEIQAEVAAEVATLKREITAHLADGHRGERLREGVSVAILGPPNAGKSSLLNALARRDVAITAPTAGTTRDVLEVALDLGGFPVLIADTAGLRAAGDDVEREGVRRALARAEAADLRLILLDVTKLEEAEGVRSLINEQAKIIVNKIDLTTAEAGAWADVLGAGPALRISVASGAGMGELVAWLEAAVAARFSLHEAPAVTRVRHRSALEEALKALQRFETAGLPELAAEELRLALRCLGRITGRVEVEELLDVIFKEFCIGK